MNYVIEAKKGNQKYYYNIYNNKVTICMSIKNAYLFDSLKAAKNTLDNNIPKDLLSLYSFNVIPYEPILYTGTIDKNNKIKYTYKLNIPDPPPLKHSNSISTEVFQNSYDKSTGLQTMLSDNNGNQEKEKIYINLNNMIGNIKKSVEEFKKYKEVINEALSYCDKEINDIQHFIEFNKLSASNGYIIYRDLHKLLNQRRELKNTLKIMDEFYSSAQPIKKFELNQRIEYYKQNKKNYIYNPRTMETSHLFE